MNASGAKLLAVLCCAAAGFAGCGGDGEQDASRPVTPGQPADFPNPRGKTIAELRKDLGPGGPVIAPAVSQLEPGPNRFAFGLFDRSRAQIADAPVALYVAPAGGGRVSGPYLASYQSLKTEPRFQSRSVASDPDAAKSLYTAQLKLPRAGRYELLGVVRLDDRLVAATPASPGIRVLRDSRVPEVGERAPRIETPTAADVGGALGEIDTREPPSTMHERDFAEVIGRRPVALIFATPALCRSKVCGPTVDIVEQVKAKLGDQAEFIHMEIYNDNSFDRGFRPQVRAFRLPTEPWLFTFDRSGRVAARLEGAFGVADVERAVKRAIDG